MTPSVADQITALVRQSPSEARKYLLALLSADLAEGGDDRGRIGAEWLEIARFVSEHSEEVARALLRAITADDALVGDIAAFFRKLAPNLDDALTALGAPASLVVEPRVGNLLRFRCELSTTDTSRARTPRPPR